jgi:CRISPR-associated protein Cmr6
MWRMVTGVGERTNAQEIGIALHGTYGWPVIPGSTLKGVTRAWATQYLDEKVNWLGSGARPAADELDAMFGPPPVAPREASDSGLRTTRTRAALHAGSLDVLDAFSAGGVLSIVVDGVTPHIQAYYGEDGSPAHEQTTAPGEWHNPVPSAFLAVSKGQFAVDVVGPAAHCDRFVLWCKAACDDLGVGAKTAAGYGYLLTDGVEL